MNIFKLTLVFCILLGSSIAQAQETPDSSSTNKDTSGLSPIYYNLGVGLLNYRGDVGVIKDLGTTENLQFGFHAGAEYKITSSLGISLNGGYATLTKNERNGDSNRNFQSKVINAGLSASFHLVLQPKNLVISTLKTYYLTCQNVQKHKLLLKQLLLNLSKR